MNTTKTAEKKSAWHYIDKAEGNGSSNAIAKWYGRLYGISLMAMGGLTLFATLLLPDGDIYIIFGWVFSSLLFLLGAVFVLHQCLVGRLIELKESIDTLKRE